MRANVLLYAALQFVALTAIAMRCYADDYGLFDNFFSELGATHAWSGRDNHLAMTMFVIALATLGIALVVFAGTWRAFSTTRRPVKIGGAIAQVFGTLSGAAFVAVACTPIDHALWPHNYLVGTAFALLLGYVTAMTVVWVRPRAPRTLLIAAVVYLVLVLGYFAVAAAAARAGFGTPLGHSLLVVSQKVFVYSSMVFVVFLTVTMRRQFAAARS